MTGLSHAKTPAPLSQTRRQRVSSPEPAPLRSRRAIISTADANASATLLPATLSAAEAKDLTERQLQRCLDDAENASPASQTGCEDWATSTDDRGKNAAYTALRRGLPANASARLRDAQRAWLLFQDANAKATSALFEARKGTMYVPRRAARQAATVRDRAMELEHLLQISRTEG